MDIVGPRRYVEIGGDRLMELPPLLVHSHPNVHRLDRVVDMAEKLVERDMLVSSFLPPDAAMELDLERRRMDLAIQLSERYLSLKMHWQWGEDVLEWIRQCETTFETNPALRPFLRPDIWPHAGRSSFVKLLEDKAVQTNGIGIEKGVGLRLAFRYLPPLACCTDQFLFYLNDSVAGSAFATWSQMSPDPVASLPPERFHFDVLVM